MGASALMDAEERNEIVVGTERTVIRYDELGRPVAVSERPRSSIRRTSAIAIVYVDPPPQRVSWVAR